jgi:hypothetical protein
VKAGLAFFRQADHPSRHSRSHRANCKDGAGGGAVMMMARELAHASFAAGPQRRHRAPPATPVVGKSVAISPGKMIW